MLTLGIGLQRVGFLLRLTQLRFRTGLRVGEHRVGALPRFGDCGLGGLPCLGDHLVGLRTGIGEHLLGLCLGAVGQPVCGVLGQAEHLGCTQVLVLGGRGRLLLLRRGLVGGLRSRCGFGLRLVDWQRLRGLGATARAGRGELLIQLADPLPQVAVLLDETGQLVLDEIEEGIDLVFVVAALADRWLTESDVVHVGRSERHRLPP